MSKGTIEICHPLTIELKYSEPISASSGMFSYGSIYIRSSGVTLKGLRFSGTIMVDHGLSGICLDECFIKGCVRIGSDCKNVSVSDCIISPERGGVGVNVGANTGIAIVDCEISRCLVGISVANETVMASRDSFNPPSAPLCKIRECTFTTNSTDVGIHLSIVSGQEDAPTAVLYPALVVDITRPEDITVDVSLSGKFATPLTFKSWPLPLDALDGKSVPRRGSKLSGRKCYLTVDGASLVVTEDARIELPEGDSGRQKRPRVPIAPSETYTKAELHYSSVLGIPAGSDRNQISSAYKRLALTHHPDKEAGNDASFIHIKNARDQLMQIVNNR